MNFGDALEKVKSGESMRLPQWSEDVRIKAQFPDDNSSICMLKVDSEWSRGKRQ